MQKKIYLAQKKSHTETCHSSSLVTRRVCDSMSGEQTIPEVAALNFWTVFKSTKLRAQRNLQPTGFGKIPFGHDPLTRVS